MFDECHCLVGLHGLAARIGQRIMGRESIGLFLLGDDRHSHTQG